MVDACHIKGGLHVITSCQFGFIFGQNAPSAPSQNPSMYSCNTRFLCFLYTHFCPPKSLSLMIDLLCGLPHFSHQLVHPQTLFTILSSFILFLWTHHLILLSCYFVHFFTNTLRNHVCPPFRNHSFLSQNAILKGMEQTRLHSASLPQINHPCSISNHSFFSPLTLNHALLFTEKSLIFNSLPPTQYICSSYHKPYLSTQSP